MAQNLGVPTVVFDIVKAFVNGLADFFSKTIASYLSKPFLGASAGIIEWCARWLTHIDRPAKVEAVKVLWSASFKIYMSTLLPISLIFLAVYLMFSSEPPSRAVLEGYVKRVGVATLVAYFSFPILDAFVWLTNQISDALLRAALCGGGECSAFGTIAAWGVGISGVLVATVASGGALLPFIFLIMIAVIVVISLRPIIVWLAASTMPIFCFFYIIGVGPLRKVNEIVEWVWGMAITLPTLSVLGAAIVALMVKLNNPGIIATFGPIGILYFFSPLILTLSFPFIVHSMMGTAGSAVSRVVEGAYGHLKPSISSLTSRWVKSAVAIGGPLAAPLYTFVPSKVAVKIHDLSRYIGKDGEKTAVSVIARNLTSKDLVSIDKLYGAIQKTLIKGFEEMDVENVKAIFSSLFGASGILNGYRKVVLDNMEGVKDLALAVSLAKLGRIDVGLYKRLTKNKFLRAFLASNEIDTASDLRKLGKRLPFHTFYALHSNGDLGKAIENDLEILDKEGKKDLLKVLSESTDYDFNTLEELIDGGKFDDIEKAVDKEKAMELIGRKLVEETVQSVNEEDEASQKLLKYLKAGGPLKTDERKLERLRSEILREKIRQMSWKEYLNFRLGKSDLNSTSYRATMRWWRNL